MFSQTSEYALRAITHLAQHHPTPQTRHQIASATKTPVDYLAKIMRTLGRASIVNSGRGVHGGFTLARSPRLISVLDVVNAVDPLKRIHSCPLSLDAHRYNLCSLHRRLDDAVRMIEDALRNSSIADLAGGDDHIRPLCNHTIEITA
jgi:Rrf2 family protein